MIRSSTTGGKTMADPTSAAQKVNARDPVVVAPDGQIPMDGYQIGDAFFFAIGGDFYIFTVTGFDEVVGMRTTHVTHRPSRATRIGSPESHVDLYLERIKKQKPKETLADAAWAATQAAGRP
jgi:hypothetical protein